MTVIVSIDGSVSATVINPIFNEPYTLQLTDGAVGSFVGNARSEYEEILTDISAHCFVPDVLDGSVSLEELHRRIDESYLLLIK